MLQLAVRSHTGVNILTRRLPSHRRSIDIKQLVKGKYNMTLSAVTNNSRVLESPPCILQGRTKGEHTSVMLVAAHRYDTKGMLNYDSSDYCLEFCMFLLSGVHLTEL